MLLFEVKKNSVSKEIKGEPKIFFSNWFMEYMIYT